MRRYGIEVDAANAQNVIRFLIKVQLVDKTLEFTRRDSFVVIPIKRELSAAELLKYPDALPKRELLRRPLRNRQGNQETSVKWSKGYLP